MKKQIEKTFVSKDVYNKASSLKWINEMGKYFHISNMKVVEEEFDAFCNKIQDEESKWAFTRASMEIDGVTVIITIFTEYHRILITCLEYKPEILLKLERKFELREFKYHPTGYDKITSLEKILGIRLSAGIECYLLRYGCIKCAGVSFNGIDSEDLLKSSLITQTKLLNAHFPKTVGCVVIESLDNDTYILVNHDDCVYQFSLGVFKNLNMYIEEYIEKRIRENLM